MLILNVSHRNPTNFPDACASIFHLNGFRPHSRSTLEVVLKLQLLNLVSRKGKPQL